VPAGTIRGEPFLDGRVVVFRGEDGVARVMSSYCPHLGADLSIGSVVGNRLQCRLHEWQFDSDGRCAKTAIGDAAPKLARLFKFPSQERYGIVWAFNGSEPLWDIPDFEFPDEALVLRVFRFPDLSQCDPWVFAANTPDIQHIKVVHKVEFSMSDPHGSVDWQKWGFRYRIVAAHQGGVPIEWKLGIRGTSIYWQEGPYGDAWLGGMVGFALPQPGTHQVFAVLAVKKGDGSAADLQWRDETFEVASVLMNRTVGEDKDLLNTIHYRPGALTKGDTTLARYVEFLRSYPRAHPSAQFIR
jgi:phenylpropionate dioxygenase-like ring-hydroxylating dioxygenase large terminal subunit